MDKLIDGWETKKHRKEKKNIRKKKKTTGKNH